MTIQLDLFEMAAADDQAERESHGIARLFTFDSDNLADYDPAFAEWKSQWGNFDSIAISHAWRFTSQNWFPRHQLTGCQPVIMYASTRCFHHSWTETCMCVGTGATPYRGRCRGCTWRSDLVADETDAVFACLDHTHPGWRHSPVIRPRPPEGKAKQQRWDQEVNDLYGDRRDGWPTITDRSGQGARAVPGVSPWGGYDIAAHSLTA